MATRTESATSIVFNCMEVPLVTYCFEQYWDDVQSLFKGPSLPLHAAMAAGHETTFPWMASLQPNSIMAMEQIGVDAFVNITAEQGDKHGRRDSDASEMDRRTKKLKNNVCEHGKRRCDCKDCGVSSICEHGKRRVQCKECGGSSICEHGKRRSQCKDCRGSSICEHSRERSKCKLCGGSSICEHGKRKSRCRECGGSSICSHGKRKSRCKECGLVCDHGVRAADCMLCKD